MKVILSNARNAMSDTSCTIDHEAETALTFCGILAEEIITARHPDHAANVVLDLIALNQSQRQNPQVVWFTRTSLSDLLKKKPDLR